MTYLAICGLISATTGIACAIFVLFHKPRNTLKIVWGLYSLGISLWGFGLYEFSILTDPNQLIILSRVINLSSLFIPIFFYHFVLLLTGRMAEKKKELTVYYVLFSLYWLAAFLNPSLFVKSISPKGGFEYYPDAGALYYAFPFVFMYLLIAGVLILYQSYKKAGVIEANKYKYFLLFSFLGLGGGATEFFLVFDIPIFPYGVILMPLYNVMVAYIIIKHRLMDINIVIRRSVIYTILIALLTVLYMTGIYALERLFSTTFGYGSLESAAVFVVMAIIFVPLRSFIQSFVDRYFFKASYLQIVEENDLLRQEVLRGERFKNLAELSRDIIREIRNPLTTLIGYKYQLEKRAADAEFLKQFTMIFDKEMGRVQKLVDRLSEFSEHKSLDLKHVNIIALVEDLLRLLEPRLAQKKISLFKFYDPQKEVYVNIDGTQIKQALQYVFLSSIKSMEEQGQVWVGMEEVGHFWEIRIKDTGHGFSKDALLRIFDPLHNLADNEGSSVLFKAQSIIMNHGGKIIVDSEESNGTEWVICLPGIVR